MLPGLVRRAGVAVPVQNAEVCYCCGSRTAANKWFVLLDS